MTNPQPDTIIVVHTHPTHTTPPDLKFCRRLYVTKLTTTKTRLISIVSKPIKLNLWLNYFCSWKCSSKNFGSRNFVKNSNFLFSKFGSKTNFGKKNLWVEKKILVKFFLVIKFVGVKIFWVKNFGWKKFLVKKFWVKKIFGSKTFLS